jgi:pimeloyl-ACP methyl ester carboxylesterase
VLFGLWSHEPAEALGSVAVPVQFFVADSGDDARRQQRRSAIESLISTTGSNVEAVWFEGAHHDVHAQRPEEVSDALVSFAQRHST